jgi:hypothetical protein
LIIAGAIILVKVSPDAFLIVSASKSIPKEIAGSADKKR